MKVLLKNYDRIATKGFGSGRKGSASFLKKRSKKLFPVGARPVDPGSKGKSLLVLFFRKELLSFS